MVKKITKATLKLVLMLLMTVNLSSELPVSGLSANPNILSGSISNVEIKTGYRKYDALNNESSVAIHFDPNTENVIALDIIIAYDESAFSYKDIIKASQLSNSMVLVNASVPGILKIGISGTSSITAGTLFTLVFSYTNPLNVSITSALANEQNISIINTVPLIGFTLDQSSVNFNNVGQTAQINANFNPVESTYQDIVWATSNALVATVSPTGLITPVGDGSATIIARTLDGDYSQSVLVKVAYDLYAPLITGVSDELSYNTDRIISYNEGTALLNGVEFVSGSTVSEEGTYTLIVIDLADNKTIVHFGIDKTAPIIAGADNNAYYNINKTITFNEGMATLDDFSFESGSLVSAEGLHTLVVVDSAGNKSQIDFHIDKSAPVITINPYTLLPTNQDITVTASTNEGVLNSETWTFTSNGEFTFRVQDYAGNLGEQTVIITNIDKIAPVISIGDYIKSPTNQDITVTASTNEGTLNSESITFTSNGEFTFSVTDEAGNLSEATVYITNIDKEAPIVTGIENNAYYNTDRTLTFLEGVVTVNDVVIESGYLITDEGTYLVQATDDLGNKIAITFTIDKTLPLITIDPYLMTPTDQDISVTASTNEGSLNVSSHTFTENGSFTFKATDAAGNVSETMVTITNIFKSKHLIFGVDGLGGIIKAYSNLLELNADSDISIGSNITFMAELSPSYHVYRWIINGTETITRNLEFELNNINTDTHVSVEFGLRGDLNSDDSVTLTDLVKLRRNQAGLENLDAKGSINADINQDNTLTLTDLVKLRRMLAGLE